MTRAMSSRPCLAQQRAQALGSARGSSAGRAGRSCRRGTRRAARRGGRARAFISRDDVLGRAHAVARALRVLGIREDAAERAIGVAAAAAHDGGGPDPQHVVGPPATVRKGQRVQPGQRALGRRCRVRLPSRRTRPWSPASGAPSRSRVQSSTSVSSPSWRTTESMAGTSRRMLAYSKVAKCPPTQTCRGSHARGGRWPRASSSDARCWKGNRDAHRERLECASAARTTESRAPPASLNATSWARKPWASTAEAR